MSEWTPGEPTVERLDAAKKGHYLCSRYGSIKLHYADFRVTHKYVFGRRMRHFHYCSLHLPVKYHGRFQP